MTEGARRLAAIMFTDMVGYTALGQRNESLSLALVEEQRKVIRPILSRHGGREVKTIGDAFLVEFPNALDAVRCAYDIQRAAREFNISLPEEKRIRLRVGLHLGDVVESQGDISGDAVNVASRIEPLAEDGGVCITRQVFDQVKGKFELPQESLGPKVLKNVSEPLEVYKVVMPWEQSPRTAASAYPTNRVAVLPFASFSPDPNDAFFADGVTDEIISAVAGISGLSVISRTSVVGYKGTTKKVEEIGRELRVGSILEGTFKKAGNRIRITTQLIEVAGDRHLWAQNYDRDLDDVFEVQSDVAKQVAEALRVRILSPELVRIERKPTESTAAYALYLKGRYHWNKRGVEDLKRALEYFELAVHDDPDFALGFVGISDCYLVLRSNWGVEPEQGLEKAKAAADRALELDSGLAEAHASKAFLLMVGYDHRRAEQEFRRAIELKPSYAMAHMWYSMLLRSQMRWDETRSEIETALGLDPLSPIINDNYSDYRFHIGDFAGAVEHYRKAIELGYVAGHEDLATTYGMMKRFDDMKRELAAWVELVKDFVPLARLIADATVAYYTDDKRTVARLLPELEAHFQEDRGPLAFQIGVLHFLLGEDARGFEWLERSYTRKELVMLFIKVMPHLDGVRTDARYLDFVKRLGLD
ncbi:MAG TPA: adenylate/guanylate cyclase domain-containing protein [Nitrososphaerales archaeon]|nr:adenylate/guanylate cyclase domain-containing protein [Nitrososphaerales archaeon]